MKTKTITSGLPIRLCMFLLVGFLATQSVMAQWLPGWSYRVPVTITNAGSALTDYQVLVTLGSSFNWSQTNNDGSDIRFTDSDGVTGIPYWIENWNDGSSARIWVKVPSVAATPVLTTIYLYYGNSGATSLSNGTTTFLFFDDFSSGAVDPAKWVEVGSLTEAVVSYNGNNVLSLRGNTTPAHTHYLATINQGFSDFVFETKVLMTQDVSASCQPSVGFRHTALWDRYITQLRGGPTQNDIFIRKYDGVLSPNWINAVAPYNYNANQFYKYKITANGNSISLFLDDVHVLSPLNDGGDVLTGGFILYNYYYTAPAYFDDVRARSFAAAEPSTGLGPEENLFPPLTVTGVVTNVACAGGSTGAIDITVSGGDGSYTYLWSPGGQIDPDLTGLSAGTYSVHVEDGNGPVGNATFTVTQPLPLVAGYGVGSLPVCSSGSATVQITASGGTEPYTGVETFQQPVGTVNYTVTDANGCSTSVPVTVNTAGVWFNNAWQYQTTLEISNPSGTVLTDFQVKVTLGSTFDFTRAKIDGSDIRFTPAGSTTEMPYWIESWDYDGRQAAVWVKVPYIPVSGTAINMYYGNSAATSASNGTATFKFFDDFSTSTTMGNWIRKLSYDAGVWGPGAELAPDWKYVMEMQNGALYYAMNRVLNGWNTASLDPEIEAEFNYMHSQLRADGTVPEAPGYNHLTLEPQYCYGLILSNFALGYLHYKTINPALSTRCYNDMLLVFNRIRVVYPNVSTLTDQGGYGFLLHGISNAWKAFTDFGNSTSAAQAVTLVQSYTATFIAGRTGGSWNGANGIQEHLKRNFGMLNAYNVTGNMAYLTAVRDNIDYILDTFWRSNPLEPGFGGLEWYSNPATSDHFYECHQQWFMIAVRLLNNLSGGTYNYLTQGEQAWHFLTDNNFTNIDMYVDNYFNHNAFFSYRQITSGGVIQVDPWKGSYEIGTALWGMSLNYDWVSSYRSSHSPQEFNYLGAMVSQIRNTPVNRGYFNLSGLLPNASLWSTVGSPTVSVTDDAGNSVASIRGNVSHNDLVASNDKSFGDFNFEARVKMTADGNLLCNPIVDLRYTDVNNRYMTQLRGEGLNDIFLRKYQAGIASDLVTIPVDYTANVYYNLKLAVNGDVIDASINNSPIYSYTDAGTGILTGGISLRNFENDNAAYFDDVRVREYASAEPVATIGSDQAQFEWTGCLNGSWDTPDNWYTGVAPGTGADIVIPDVTIYPVLTGTLSCNNIVLEPMARMTVASTGVLTVGGTLTINSLDTGHSGSLIVEGNGTVTGIVIYNRFLRPENNRGERHFFSSPVVGQSVPGFTAINGSKIAQISTVYQIWEWVENASNTWPLITGGNFESGRGYNIAQASGSDGLFAFTGTLALTPSVTATAPYNSEAQHYNNERGIWGGGGWNLLGNPFTSSMRVTDEDLDGDDGNNENDFLGRNLNSFDPSYQAVYIYDGTVGEHGTYYYIAKPVPFADLITGDDPAFTDFESKYVQAGQGFYVLANYNNVTFSFTREMQAHNTGVTMTKSAKTEESWPGMHLKVKSGESESYTTVVYNGNMSLGLDPGYDVGQLSSGQDVSVYTTLAEKDNSVNFSRQALPLEDSDKTVIKVGIDSEGGGEMTFSAYTVPIGNKKFWLEDRVTGIFTDLTTKSYTVTLPAKTYGTGRFYIIASVNTPTGIRPPGQDNDDLRVWASDERLIITGTVSDRAVCEVYDMQGRKIVEKNLLDAEQNIVILPAGLNGVLIIKVTDGSDVTTRRVAVL